MGVVTEGFLASDLKSIFKSVPNLILNLKIWVGEILISINSPTCFACRVITGTLLYRYLETSFKYVMLHFISKYYKLGISQHSKRKRKGEKMRERGSERVCVKFGWWGLTSNWMIQLDFKLLNCTYQWHQW